MQLSSGSGSGTGVGAGTTAGEGSVADRHVGVVRESDGLVRQLRGRLSSLAIRSSNLPASAVVTNERQRGHQCSWIDVPAASRRVNSGVLRVEFLVIQRDLQSLGAVGSIQ